MENYPSGNSNTTTDPELGELLRHLFRLRNRLKIVLPENIVALKRQLEKANIGGKTGSIHDIDLFFNVCSVLSHNPVPITMGELSQALEVPMSTATRIMDWLVSNEYAQRLADPGDRRVVRVALTDAGQEIFHMIDNFLLKRIDGFISQFSPDELTHLKSLLRKIIQTIETSAGVSTGD